MSLRAEGRRFVQELRRNRRARLLAHQTIASMDGGWGGGILQNRMRPVVLTAAARRGCLSRGRPRAAARAFIATWRDAPLQERSAAQEHCLDRCRLLDEPTPAEADPTGATYCVERGARTDTGGDGWADVWTRLRPVFRPARNAGLEPALGRWEESRRLCGQAATVLVGTARVSASRGCRRVPTRRDEVATRRVAQVAA